MSVCEYPNNVSYFKEKCPGEEKYNMCYGEDTKFSTLEKLEEHVSKIQKDANHYEKMKDIFTLGCWENKNNSPFIEDWKKLEEKDPIKCMENDKKSLKMLVKKFNGTLYEPIIDIHSSGARPKTKEMYNYLCISNIKNQQCR